MITITIETDNAAFEDDPGAEVARILREMAAHCAEDGIGGAEGNYRDANGNTCAKFSEE